MRLSDVLSILLLLTFVVTGCSTKPEEKSSASTKAPPVEAVALTPGRIEPGVGIEEVKLGATRVEVEQNLGAPTGHDSNEYVEGQTYLLYHPKGIELLLHDDTVQVITLHAAVKEWSAYTGGTPEGAGIGRTSQEITDALGAPEEEAPRALTYVGKGLKFRFAEDRDGGARAETLSLVKVEASP